VVLSSFALVYSCFHSDERTSAACQTPGGPVTKGSIHGWMTLTKILVPMCLYTLSKFGQLILRKLLKIIATRCHILRLKCTKFNFGDLAGGAYSAPQEPLAGFGVLLLRGWEGKEGERNRTPWLYLQVLLSRTPWLSLAVNLTCVWRHSIFTPSPSPTTTTTTTTMSSQGAGQASMPLKKT